MATSTIPSNFVEQSKEFLSALVTWERNLHTLAWSDLHSEAKQERVALISVDMINGFCHEGVLSSPRVKNIIPAVVAAFKGAYNIGVREFVLAQDCHTPESVEFADFPPHCQAGTNEANTIPELANLPFANLYRIVSKNSLNAFHGTDLGEWLEARHHFRAPVIVAENAVQTYDMSVETENAIGALPHDGDFMHLVFLYHMRLNGVEVVREIV